MKKLLYLLYFLITAFRISAQTLPALPNTSTIETCYPDISGYTIITVGPVGRDYSDLQLAINDANPGSILVLDAGASFKGSFNLPDKSGNDWIIITSSRMDLLPQQGFRVIPGFQTLDPGFPKQVDAMPKIITTNLSGLPCFKTQAKAHHYRLTGLEITIDKSVLNSYGLVQLGDGSSAQNTLAQVPHDFIIDRCYIHGHTDATVMKAGVLLNCANSAIIDSHISDFHSIGYDTYAIGGTNGPGPFIIRNNYLEAAGENIIFGGAATSIPGLVPSDIEVTKNYFFKPFSWRVGHPTYAGKHWTIKNLFELKTGVRVLLEGNILENSWADLPIGQSGAAILLTVRGEGGGSPQAEVSDITIRNNIIRNAGSGISLSGHDDQSSSQKSKRINISNNLFENISGPDYGDGNVDGPNDGIMIKIGDPEDVIIEHNTVFQTGAITWVYDTVKNFVFRNNLVNCFLSAGGYQGMYGPGFAQGGNGPMGKFFPDITDANQHFHKNVLIGGNASKYSNYATISKNYFPSNAASVGFIDYPNGPNDYHNYGLSNSSIYKNDATDGKDIGVDFVSLDSAMINSNDCVITNTYQPSKGDFEIKLAPNPLTSSTKISFDHEVSEGVLCLFDIYGKPVLTIRNIKGESIIIEKGNLYKGVYILKLQDNDKISSCIKLVID